MDDDQLQKLLSSESDDPNLFDSPAMPEIGVNAEEATEDQAEIQQLKHFDQFDLVGNIWCLTNATFVITFMSRLYRYPVRKMRSYQQRPASRPGATRLLVLSSISGRSMNAAPSKAVVLGLLI